MITDVPDIDQNPNTLPYLLPPTDDKYAEKLSATLPNDSTPKEFEKIKILYEEYQANTKKITRQYQLIEVCLRIAGSILPVFIGLAMINYLEHYVFIVWGISQAISTAIIFSYNVNNRIKEEVSNLKIEFLLRYKCPNCKKSFGETPWQIIFDQKKCSSCKHALV
jgi:hypothetical protein